MFSIWQLFFSWIRLYLQPHYNNNFWKLKWMNFHPTKFNNLPLKKWCDWKKPFFPFRMVNSHGLLLMVQKSGDHQLRLVVYPIICRVLCISSCFLAEIWTINSMFWSLAPKTCRTAIFLDEAKKEVKKQKAKKKRLETWVDDLGVSPTHDASETIICSFLWRVPEKNLHFPLLVGRGYPQKMRILPNTRVCKNELLLLGIFEECKKSREWWVQFQLF